MRRGLLIAGVAVLALLILLVAVWAIDRGRHSGSAMRNVSFASTQVGGLSEAEVRGVVARLDRENASRPVTVETPNGTLETTAGALGLIVDEPATVAAVMDAGRDGSWLTAPFSWFGALFTGHDVEPVYRTDSGATAAATAELRQANLTPPVEPNLTVEDDRVVVVPGVPGVGIDLGELDRALIAAGDHGGPIDVSLGLGPVAPNATDADAERVAAEANQLSGQPIVVQVAGKSVTVDPTTVRGWLRAAPAVDGGRLALSADVEAVDRSLHDAVGTVGTAPVQLSWQVNGGTVSFTPGKDGTTCCAPDSAARIVQALQAGQRTIPLELTAAPPDHDAAWANSLGIRQPVATFTTPHACCEPRVQNIHRIADLVRGAVIEPGKTFSVNDFVGQRTKAKGFVEAGVIYAGKFTEDVGGGVSQFATTLFNAAFFGGLDIPEYQAHTIYISRYPYGREATLSYPKPDLKITNNTPHGILIWPTYNDTSITVTLYSTPFVEGAQTGQSTQPSGACTKVTTQRTRTWLADGRQANDNFFATYQPEEGVLC